MCIGSQYITDWHRLIVNQFTFIIICPFSCHFQSVVSILKEGSSKNHTHSPISIMSQGYVLVHICPTLCYLVRNGQLWVLHPGRDPGRDPEKPPTPTFLWECMTKYTIYTLVLHLSSIPPQACGDPATRPTCLTEKALESAIKFVVKKFPNIDTKVSSLLHWQCNRYMCTYYVLQWVSFRVQSSVVRYSANKNPTQFWILDHKTNKQTKKKPCLLTSINRRDRSH